MKRPNPLRPHATSAGVAALVLMLQGTAPVLAETAPAANGAAQVAITLTGDNGGSCLLSHAEAKAGPVTFTVMNKTATAITEVELMSDNRILGEKENLAPGLPPVSFTVTLGGGNYKVYCPGATEETVAFKVTGEAAARPTSSVGALLLDGTKGYAAYVDTTVDGMVTAIDRLKAAIDAGDLATAQKNYALARPFYERIESDVEGFVLPGFEATDNAGNLDYLIDMRESNLDPKVGWHGLHAIERDLFARQAITDGTKTLVAELQKNAGLLDYIGTNAGIQARRPCQWRCGPAGRGAERQDQRRGRGVQPYRPGGLFGQCRGRAAGLCLPDARHVADRPRPDPAGSRPVRRGHQDARRLPRPEWAGRLQALFGRVEGCRRSEAVEGDPGAAGTAVAHSRKSSDGGLRAGHDIETSV